MESDPIESMRTLRWTVALTNLLALTPTAIVAQQGVDTALVANLLVSRMRLQPGERVLLLAIRGRSDALIPALRRRIVAAGATDLGVLPAAGEPEATWVTDFTRAAPTDRAGLATYLASVDLAVVMPGTN